MNIVLPYGTIVRTESGDAPVGSVASGAKLLTADAEFAAAWFGSTRAAGMAVEFDLGALGVGKPPQKLYLPVDILLCLDNSNSWAVAAGLANGDTICRCAWPSRMQLATISIDGHGIMLTQGLAVRSFFEAGSAPTPRDRSRLLVSTAIRSAVAAKPARSDMFERSRDRDAGFVADVSSVQLIAGGRWVEFTSLDRTGADLIFSFSVPAAAMTLQIVSPPRRPNGENESDPDDRRFGIAIKSITINGDNLPLSSAALVHGFHDLEGDSPDQWRWTNGSAIVQLKPATQPREMTLSITNWHELLT